ncbi:MAG: hypothetical protein WC915_02065 [archaeon]|jgi:hypothetical protein
MDFKVDFGPWETIFKGTFYTHEVEIVVNPENFFLTIIYEKEDGKNIGALVDGSKALVAKGQMESFIQTLPKTAVGLIKTNGDTTSKMIFISFDPIYLDFRKDDYVRALDNAIKKSFDNSDNVRGLAKSSSLELKEINLTSKTEYNQILGDPFLARSLLGGLKKTAMELINIGELKSLTKQSNNKIQLGLSKNREIITEEIGDLYQTNIVGENVKELNYVAYILAENFLLNNNTTIIFDSEKYFDGLGQASKHEHELKEALVAFEPAGFPLKKFIAKTDLKVPIKNIDLTLAFNLMNTGDDELNTIVSTTKVDANTVNEYLEKIKEAKEINDFHILKIERLLKILDKEDRDLFGLNLNTTELIKSWSGNIGRATIIDISDLKNNEKILFILGVLTDILALGDKIKNSNLVLMFPQMQYVLKNDQDKITNKILELQKLGVGFVIGTTTQNQKLSANETAKMNLIKDKDIAVSIKNKRNYRVNLRPSISGDPQIK